MAHSEVVRGQKVEVSGCSQFNSGGYTPTEQKSITRPENTTVYGANDIIVGVGTAPANIWAFPVASPTGGYIVGLKMTATDTGITGNFRFHFMNAIPATFTDNAALTLTLAEIKTNYIGYADGTVESIGGQDIITISNLRIPYYTNSLPLYVIPQTLTGFTPSANSTVFDCTLIFENNIPNAFPELY